MEHAANLRNALKTGSAYRPSYGDEPIDARTVRAALIDTSFEPDPKGLTIVGATITGCLDLAFVVLRTPLRFHDCHLDLLTAERLRAPLFSLARSSVAEYVDLDGSNITGDVFLDEGFRCSGQIRMVGATIGGQLGMKDAKLTGPATVAALHFDGAHINGDVFLDEGFQCSGQIRMVGATIGGQLSLKGTRLNATGMGNEAALHFDRATVHGNLFLDDNFCCSGQVRMLGATIGGQLSMRDATLTGPATEAVLHLDRATINGSVFLDDDFSCSGQVRLVGAKIGGQLSMKGAILTGTGTETEAALRLDGATIAGNVVLGNGFGCSGQVRMLGTTISGELRDDISSWSTGSTIDGCTYGVSIVGPLAHSSWCPEKRICWLDQLQYASSAYKYLADQYRQHGYPKAAEDVLIAMRARRRKSLGRIWRILDWLFEKVVGYGLRPVRLVATMSFLIILAWFGLRTDWTRSTMAADSSGFVVFADGNVINLDSVNPMLTPSVVREGCGPTPEIECYEPFVYGLDTMLPLVDFNQDETWRPDSTTKGGRAVAAILAFGRLLGWIFAAAATVTVGRFIQDNRQ